MKGLTSTVFLVLFGAIILIIIIITIAQSLPHTPPIRLTGIDDQKSGNHSLVFCNLIEQTRNNTIVLTACNRTIIVRVSTIKVYPTIFLGQRGTMTVNLVSPPPTLITSTNSTVVQPFIVVNSTTVIVRVFIPEPENSTIIKLYYQGYGVIELEVPR